MLVRKYANKDTKNVDYVHANDDKQDIGVQDVEGHMEPDAAVAKYAAAKKPEFAQTDLNGIAGRKTTYIVPAHAPIAVSIL